jgi:peptide/nickel transport system permease protein
VLHSVSAPEGGTAGGTAGRTIPAWVPFVAKRLAGLVITLLLSSLLIYGALYLAPGSPLAFLSRGQLDNAALANLKAQYHLNEPFIVQYWDWLDAAIHGNLGQSILIHESVAKLIAPRFGITLFLVAYAAVLVLLIALPLGLAGPLLGRRVDTAVVAVSSVAIAIPSFVAAVLLIFVFGVKLNVFPTFGPGGGFTNRLWHMTLPAISLALANIGYVSRISRAAIKEELGREHVETARSRGIPESLVIRRHVVRNAMIPITTVGAIATATMIAGAVVVETTFSLGGIGSYLIQSVEDKDFAVVQAICLILVTIFVIASVLVDVVCALLDPRVGLGGNRG